MDLRDSDPGVQRKHLPPFRPIRSAAIHPDRQTRFVGADSACVDRRMRARLQRHELHQNVLRTRLNAQRLSDLMRVYLVGPPLRSLTDADWNAILRIWVSMKARKVQLPDLSSFVEFESVFVDLRTKFAGDFDDASESVSML